MMTLIDFPSEDTSDLTDDELAKSIAAKTAEDMIPVLNGHKCVTCQKSVRVTKYKLGRRAPHLYARVILVCQDGHPGLVTFRADFLGGT